MIVTCEQCKTRFKIPDEKVTPDKGVKVRCTRCRHTFRVTRDMAATDLVPAHTAVAPAAAPERDPFAAFGTPTDASPFDPTRRGVFALGVEASRLTELKPNPGLAPAFDFSHLGAPAGPPPSLPAAVPFDFGTLAAPPAPAPPAVGSGGAFDFAALEATRGPAPATPAFDFSALGSPPPPPPPPGPAAPLRQDVAALASTPGMDFSSLPAPAPAPARWADAGSAPEGPDHGGPPAPRRSPAREVAEARAPRPELPVRPAPAIPGELNPDAFFGAPTAAPARQPLLDLPEDATQETARSALFEMPRELPTPAPAPSAPEPSEAAAASASLSPARAPSAASGPVEALPRRRTALGVVVNLVIAAALVLGLLVVGSALLNEGKLSPETLSLSALKASFVTSSDFVVADISNGLYATRAGRSVFFVRGEVQNRSGASARVSVRADLIEGTSVVRTGRGLAGAVPTPEELYNLAEGQTPDALFTKVAGRAVPLDPGASAGFLVVFTEFPPDLKGFRVRVSAQAESVSTTASRP
jgi:predicted Zn finger-like uncharacterized protein